MGAFAAALQRAVKRAPEARLAAVMGMDGITVERVCEERGGDALEGLAAEVCGLMRKGLAGSDDIGMGPVQELVVGAAGAAVVVRGITSEYVLVLALRQGALIGRARAAVRLACLELEEQFQ
jgi:predicted regulator of Ras-like GTPase activity (Roadblock/LC7/MglB family)